MQGWVTTFQNQTCMYLVFLCKMYMDVYKICLFFHFAVYQDSCWYSEIQIRCISVQISAQESFHFPSQLSLLKNNGNNIFTTSLYPNTLRPSLLLPQRGDFYNSNFVFFLSTTISLHSFPQWFGLTLEF